MVSRKQINQMAGLVDALRLPAGFDLARLTAAVEKRRQRRILCLPAADLDTGAEVCGLVVSSPEKDLDVIFYAPSLVAWHMEHTVAHELGHLMAEHAERATPLPGRLTEQIRPLLQARYHNPLVGRMLGRYRFDSAEEQEAELFAGLVLAGRSEHEEPEDPVAGLLQPNGPRNRRR
jgi:hypothetical protein